MSPWRLLSGGLLCAALLAAGCTTSSSVRTGSGSVNVREMQDAVRLNHARIQSMQGEGRISVETPQLAQSGSFQLSLRKPDSLLLMLQGPFGIRVGSALLTRSGFQFYNSFENKLIEGASSPENLRRILHISLSFDDLLDLFAGGVFVADDDRAPDAIETEDALVRLTYDDDTGRRIYWLDPALESITKIQVLNTDHKLILEQTFSDFETTDRTVLPRSLRLLRPKDRQAIALRYSDLTINPPSLQFAFRIPSNVQRIHW